MKCQILLGMCRVCYSDTRHSLYALESCCSCVFTPLVWSAKKSNVARIDFSGSTVDSSPSTGGTGFNCDPRQNRFDRDASVASSTASFVTTYSAKQCVLEVIVGRINKALQIFYELFAAMSQAELFNAVAVAFVLFKVSAKMELQIFDGVSLSVGRGTHGQLRCATVR